METETDRPQVRRQSGGYSRRCEGTSPDRSVIYLFSPSPAVLPHLFSLLSPARLEAQGDEQQLTADRGQEGLLGGAEPSRRWEEAVNRH
jgi:hypothetical protein